MGFFRFSLGSIGRVYASHDFVVVPYALANLIGDIFIFFYMVVDEPNENIYKVIGNQLWQVDLLVMGFIVYCWRVMHKVVIHIGELFTL